MTKVHETRSAARELDRAPKQIQRAYEIWARLVETHGVAILREFQGYRDEKLQGQWQGYRSSRLNLQWRVIYRVDRNEVLEIVEVCRVSAHDYRR